MTSLVCNALAGTPSQLGQVFGSGHPIVGQLRSAIWFGEPCDEQTRKLHAGSAAHVTPYAINLAMVLIVNAATKELFKVRTSISAVVTTIEMWGVAKRR